MAIEGWETNPILESSVERIYASESSCPNRSIPISQAYLQIHVFQPYPDDSYDECTLSGDGEEEVVSASVTEVPSRSLEGLWESLIYPDGVKSKLLDYIYATISFSDADVDCRDRPFPQLRKGTDYMRLISVLQLISCLGTEWFSSTGLQEPEKPLYAERSPRNFPSDSLKSKEPTHQTATFQSPHPLRTKKLYLSLRPL